MMECGMKIDLTALQQKLANGAFIGFTLAEAEREPADKSCEVKLDAAKMAPVKLGISKSGLSKSGLSKT